MNIGLLYKSGNELQSAKLWLLRGYRILHANLGDQHPETRKAANVMKESDWNEGKMGT